MKLARTKRAAMTHPAGAALLRRYEVGRLGGSGWPNLRRRWKIEPGARPRGTSLTHSQPVNRR